MKAVVIMKALVVMMKAVVVTVAPQKLSNNFSSLLNSITILVAVRMLPVLVILLATVTVGQVWPAASRDPWVRYVRWYGRGAAPKVGVAPIINNTQVSIDTPMVL